MEFAGIGDSLHLQKFWIVIAESMVGPSIYLKQNGTENGKWEAEYGKQKTENGNGNGNGKRKMQTV